MRGAACNLCGDVRCAGGSFGAARAQLRDADHVDNAERANSRRPHSKIVLFSARLRSPLRDLRARKFNDLATVD